MKYEDILYQKQDSVATITINRPEVHNAFRTQTIQEMTRALDDATLDEKIGVIVLTGSGNRAFCSGGDIYEQHSGDNKETRYWNSRLNNIIRSTPKPVIAAVNGYALGGGLLLHILCDLTIASETAKFGQAGPKVGSFEGGFGSAYLARMIGDKRAKEIWFLCRQYTAQEAYEMGMVNKVVPADKLKEEVKICCDEILALSPTAIKFEKLAINADSDNIYAFDDFSRNAVCLFYHTEEANEGKKAFREKRKPDWDRFR